MPLETQTCLLTGASGGIGHALALKLAQNGCKLVLSARSPSKLQALADELPAGQVLACVPADLTQAQDLQQLVAIAQSHQVDTLINLSGTNQLTLLEDMSAEDLTNMISLNLIAPMQLSRMMIKHLSGQKKAMIVNVGSVFGTIGHPGYTGYCASKFGLRGFTEALRRELQNKPVDVLYIAPRSTSTLMNSDSANQLNAALGNHSDTPDFVATQILKTMQQKAKNTYLGWPERLFVQVNQLLPGVVDRALNKKLATIEQFAKAT